MGSSESKMNVTAEIKANPAMKHGRVGQLMDPRSPSAGIDRTPIQVGVSKLSAEVKSECPLAFTDPRSPTVGIVRTPVREVMRATIGSFARQLTMLFHNETEGKAIPPKHYSVDAVEDETIKAEDLASSEPLLIPQCSLAEHADLLATPALPPPQSMNSPSTFMHLNEEPQVELEINTEADLTLEEAEEARETPLHKRLSMSLLTCHEGAASSLFFSDAHSDSFSSPVRGVELEQLGDGVDHSYALLSTTFKPESHIEPSLSTDADDSADTNPPSQPEEAKQMPSSEETKEPEVAKRFPVYNPSEVPAAVLSPKASQLSTRIHCLTIDPRSPSQVVFKPQWLGKGFGGTGQRNRGVQGKGGSSPLTVRVAVKNATNDKKGQSGKLKQKGTEGRSPLQILQETNSPRERPQIKLKVSTPDRQRLGQTDRRVMVVALDKENR